MISNLFIMYGFIMYSFISFTIKLIDDFTPKLKYSIVIYQNDVIHITFIFQIKHSFLFFDHFRGGFL